MSILNEVDKPGSNVETYVQDLDKILLSKINMIETLRQKLLNFNRHLKTEETLSKLYEQNQKLAEQDQTDMNNRLDESINLLEGHDQQMVEDFDNIEMMDDF